MKEICIRKHCKECPEQAKCFGCETHNYILIKQESTSNLYKCSKCGDKLRLDKNNACCECIYTCKGKVKSVIDKGIYMKCNKFNKGGKEDED